MITSPCHKAEVICNLDGADMRCSECEQPVFTDLLPENYDLNPKHAYIDILQDFKKTGDMDKALEQLQLHHLDGRSYTKYETIKRFVLKEMYRQKEQAKV